MDKQNENYFIELNSIDLSEKTKKKNGLSYVSWAWAWGELKKKYPDAQYQVYSRIVNKKITNIEKISDLQTKSTELESQEEIPYFTDGSTCWVKVGVTVNKLEHIELLPIMDNRNQSVTVNSITSVLVNKAIQRALTKAIARHGIGLYVYAGEDLPETIAVSLDVDQAKKAAEAYKIEGEIDIEKEKNIVIDLVKILNGTTASEEVFKYIPTIIPNKKISALTKEDTKELLKIKGFLLDLQNQLANK